MKKVSLKLGSVKEMLTKEEMKKIAGGYAMCCCIGGVYGNLDCTHSWSRSLDSTGSCYHTCTDPNSQNPGTGGALWDSSSLCNHWGHC
ncbi:hypothetical protein [Mucilaginibacter xinganensis]|uniref:Natural product n=1 Tax=Mucilaginibacter xinganensis TaxID=1234841 RepID=A0A223NU38_9SPHI|nr:hypothetical protein [Mucilaginibacter xinganensis]ASU33377.1 hypothetical protein MuYL_1479 [Mucilaginibacter xinganensis]